ncbi:MAG: cytochrome c [Myxococcales bacterium]|nr:cytochrome c [Myxococcales bacterium]
MSRSIRRHRVVLALTAAGVLVACQGSAPDAYEEELAREPAASRHAVHSERLAEVMKSLDRLANERLPPEMDVETASGPWVAELVDVSEAIARSSEQIPQAAFQASLTRSEHVTFHQAAALLRERALRIAREAETMTPAERRGAVLDLRESCEGCHQDFRAPPEDATDAAREADGG